MIEINNVTNEIQNLIALGKFDEASELYLSLINTLKEDNSLLLGKVYNDYAYFLFDLNEYELSLLMFQNSYNLNFEKEKTKSFLYQSFIEPNQEEFRNTYNTNVEYCRESIIYNEIPSFDELPLDFIPVDINKYFIFDKTTNQFEGLIDFSIENKHSFKSITFNNEFSDILIVDNWNFSTVHDYILSSNDRKLYYIGIEALKTISFLKLPNVVKEYCSNIIWADSINSLQVYFHNNTSVYMPRIYYSIYNKYISDVTQMIKDEHNYRLTPKGRNTTNVILTLGIPSYNRGQRALSNVLHLIRSEYDAEIEIIVSDNCSIKNTVGYDDIQKINDSRIIYFKFDDKPGQNSNFLQPSRLANGKYVLLISDEDTVVLESISHYLAILKNNPNISFAKGRGNTYYNDNAGRIYSKGNDAFLKSFLTTNYITGLIFKTNLFHSLDIYSWLVTQVYTNYAVRSYTHSCWSALLTLHGDYLEDDTLLFIEGSAESDTILSTLEQAPRNIPSYATIEIRLKQHYGFIDILNQLNLDKDTYIKAYNILCGKSFLLMYIVKDAYINSGYEWYKICEQCANGCVDGIVKINIALTKEEQNDLLVYIDNLLANFIHA